MVMDKDLIHIYRVFVSIVKDHGSESGMIYYGRKNSLIWKLYF